MKIVEIRELDGPNLFLLRPAIKVEIAVTDEDPATVSAFAEAFIADVEPTSTGASVVEPERFLVVLTETINRLHDLAGVERPDVVHRVMETPGHYVVAYSWERRKLAVDAAHIALDLIAGKLTQADLDVRTAALQHLSAKPATPKDLPSYLRDSDRHLPIIGITGTNGKTTTTRLISAILMHAGYTVGWTSTSGVYIQGEERIAGDYTGPSGASHVLKEGDVQIAVLETARGGMLLRGIGYESNDISVVTNISPDHLGLHGVHTVEGLAEVKSLVPRVTKPDGYAVLNADDPLVVAMRYKIDARIFLVSRRPDNPVVLEHVAAGGWALILHDGLIHWYHAGLDDVVTSISEIPITFGGRAEHMVENALCGTAAVIAFGVPLDQVRSGLASFQPDPEQNRGRLNVFEKNGVTVVVDYAHNEAGLVHLLALGRAFAEERGARLLAIIGSAGDRTDEALRILGRTAAHGAEVVIIKSTNHYQRGRETEEIARLIQEGVVGEGFPPAVVSTGEVDGLQLAMAQADRGDVIVMMCTEEYDDIVHILTTPDEAPI